MHEACCGSLFFIQQRYMTREEIIQEVTTRVGETSLSTRTIGDYVDANLPAEGTEPDEAYWEKHVGVLKSLSGNYSHDVKAFVDDWKDKHPDTEPDEKKKKVEPDNQLEERLKKLENELTAERSRRRGLERTEMLSAKGKELKVANEALWRDVVKGIEATDEDTDKTLLKKAKEAYESKLKAYMGDGVQPYSSTGGVKTVDEKTATARRDAFFKSVGARKIDN